MKNFAEFLSESSNDFSQNAQKFIDDLKKSKAKQIQDGKYAISALVFNAPFEDDQTKKMTDAFLVKIRGFGANGKTAISKEFEYSGKLKDKTHMILAGNASAEKVSSWHDPEIKFIK